MNAYRPRIYSTAVDISARTQGDRVQALLALAYELEHDGSDQRMFADATTFFSEQDQKLSKSTWWKVRNSKYLVTSYSFLSTLARFLDVEPQVLTREHAELPVDMGEGMTMLHDAKVRRIIDFVEQQFGAVDDQTRLKLTQALG